MRLVLTLLTGVLVVLAGCSGLPTDAGEGTPPQTDAATATTPEPARASEPTTTASPSPTARAEQTSATVTATPTASPDDGATVGTADNPWGEATISVALVRNGHAETDYDEALRGALDYWESHMALADYQVGFEVVDDQADADVRVELQETVESCGYDQGADLVGCAPLVERGTSPDRPATVRIETGFDRRSTRSVLIHEFGHLLGIEHGEPPEVYMTANNTLFTVEQPDATERASPWSTSEFRVYVDTAGLPRGEREGTREQVRHAVEYYNRVRDADADVPANVSFELVDDPTVANVVVSFPADLPCGAEEGSCSGRYGPDLDGDGAIEYYDRLNVTIGGLDTDARGWHVGYWFGRSLGIDESRLPDPFVDPTYRDIRSDWWTEAP